MAETTSIGTDHETTSEKSEHFESQALLEKDEEIPEQNLDQTSLHNSEELSLNGFMQMQPESPINKSDLLQNVKFDLGSLEHHRHDRRR
jgi:hypothetical protein